MPRLRGMRILHTSDWHLGRSFHNTDMLSVQQHAIDFIVATITERDIDLVLISGDVYDRALPPVDAVRMFDQALVDLRAAGAEVVVTSGNHDSAIRLGFMSRMMRNAGVYIRTMPESVTEPVVFDDGKVCVWTVPYLEPRLHAAEFGVDANHYSIMSHVMEQVHAEIVARGLEDATHLMMAHLFAAGASGSDSERNIGEHVGAEIGSLGQVPADIFQGMDYVALGHLHGRQTMSDTVRYSGSPVAYSFSEHQHRKGMWLIETDDMTVDWVDIPQPKKLAVLNDELEPLLESDEYAWAEEAWCQITVTDPQRPPRAFQRLKQRFPDMLNFILAPTGGVEQQTTYSDRIAKATTDLDLVLDFVHHVRNREASVQEHSWLQDALNHVNRVKEQDVK